MEYYNNILCVSRDELVKYQADEIVAISDSNYKNWAKAGYIAIMRRGCNGRKALYRFDRLQSDIKKAIKEKFGAPADAAGVKPFIESIVPDSKARRFFKTDFLLENGKYLPEDVQELYVNDASILNAVRENHRRMMEARSAKGKRNIAPGWWGRVKTAVTSGALKQEFENTIPHSERAIRRKYNEYVEEGYASLVSKKFGNQNTVAITEQSGEWLVARYATPINKVSVTQLFVEFNEIAQEQGWKEVKSVETLKNYLYLPEIKPRWYGMRYGELKAKEKFVRQQRTILPSRRDSLWYSDGTKLNYYYRGESGIETCQVYEVIDAYSEKLLGFHVSKSEDFEAQFFGLKMAIQTAGYKPYEMRFDNQGGHKKLESSNFLGKLSKLAIPTMPYNGKSKTIENAFYRLQMQHLRRDWFFTGQNITTTKLESKANTEYVYANRHELPTLEEVIEVYKKRRNEWNEAKHPKTHKSRNETYYSSVNEDTEKVEIFDQIDLFWLTTQKKSTYRASGIEIQVKKEKFAFEVLDEMGDPNYDFLAKNVDEKFFVKYDPSDMSMVALYDEDSRGELRFVEYAQPYVKIHRAVQDQEAGEAAFIHKTINDGKLQRIDRQEAIEEIMEKFGMHPSQHGLKMPRIKGISKKKTAQLQDIGAETKRESNMVPMLEDSQDLSDLL